MTPNDILRSAYSFHHMPPHWEFFVGGMMKREAQDTGHKPLLPFNPPPRHVDCEPGSNKGRIMSVLRRLGPEMSRADIYAEVCKDEVMSENSFKHALENLGRNGKVKYRRDGRGSHYRLP